MIDSEKVFLIETAGTAPTLKTYDKLNQRCIPQPLPATGHPAVGDPVNHPWTTSAGISYTTEAVIWGAFIEQHLSEFGGKAKVAALEDQQRLRHHLRQRPQGLPGAVAPQERHQLQGRDRRADGGDSHRADDHARGRASPTSSSPMTVGNPVLAVA